MAVERLPPLRVKRERDAATALIALFDAIAEGTSGFLPSLVLHDQPDGLVAHVLRLWCSARALPLHVDVETNPSIGTWDVMRVDLDLVSISVLGATRETEPRLVEDKPWRPADDVLHLSNTDERRALRETEDEQP